MFLDTIPGGEEREAFVHEMGHQWRVNQVWRIPSPPTEATGGHCSTAWGKTLRQYGTDLLCVMTRGQELFSSSEASDGVVGFHYDVLGTVEDSEYLTIRLRAEPVPQNEIQGRTLQ